MILTDRDIRLIKHIALAHVLSRDQIIRLGFFSSVSRTNTRLRVLRELGFVKKIETPFFSQSLYAAGANAPDAVGSRIAALLAGRSPSPRFLQHSLAVTNIAVALRDKGEVQWRFEQQLRTSFQFGNQLLEVRPDGMAIMESGAVLIEADMGQKSLTKIAEKFATFDAFLTSGECKRRWPIDSFNLLCVTTGKLRASRLAALKPSGCRFALTCTTFEELGAGIVGGWS